MSSSKSVIMLDIDGVLNSRQYIDSLVAQDQWDGPEVKYTADGKFLQSEMDPLAVARLNRITNATDAKIVVSSTWRLAFHNDAQGLYRLQDCFLSYGIIGEIIGMTPDFVSQTGSLLLAHGTRSDEIREWISHSDIKISSLVILDDETITGFDGQFIQTKFETGLLDEHVDQAIAILGKK
jgi:hypothetical protein